MGTARNEDNSANSTQAELVVLTDSKRVIWTTLNSTRRCANSTFESSGEHACPATDTPFLNGARLGAYLVHADAEGTAVQSARVANAVGTVHDIADRDRVN